MASKFTICELFAKQNLSRRLSSLPSDQATPGNWEDFYSKVNCVAIKAELGPSHQLPSTLRCGCSYQLWAILVIPSDTLQRLES